METNWYKVVRAQVVTYTDPKNGMIHTKNVVTFYGGMHRDFDYVEDGGRAMLLREGDYVAFVGNGVSGKISNYR